MPLAPVRQDVPALGAHSASVMQTRRELPLVHSPVALATTQAGTLIPPPTQHTSPASQLVGVHGGAVHTRAPPPLPPPLPPPRGEQVFSAGHVLASVQT
jgi:hypothetical protein